MSKNKLEVLEDEINDLIKLSQQLKEVNEHLSKKNNQLSKENNQLSENLDIAKDGISKIIKKYKVINSALSNVSNPNPKFNIIQSH